MTKQEHRQRRYAVVWSAGLSSDCNDSGTLTLSLMCGTLTAISKGNLDILQNLDILHILNSGLSHKIL